jgi:AhpD family alkylhydroperoxidase
MQARIGHPMVLVPDAAQAIMALGKATKAGGVPEATLDLVHLRASQINGCTVCVDMHAREVRRAGAGEAKAIAVAAWEDSPHFTDAERAALRLTEAVTRLADRADAVPDAVWDEAAKHYDEKQLANLVMSIAVVNLWNRLNRATRQVPA